MAAHRFFAGEGRIYMDCIVRSCDMCAHCDNVRQCEILCHVQPSKTQLISMGTSPCKTYPVFPIYYFFLQKLT